jgi:RNA-directed DNA polymerase
MRRFCTGREAGIACGPSGWSGVDAQTIAEFEKKLGDNLYKLWSRMESGSYFPPPVKAVPIPKKSGGMRILGVPTVADRVAQTVVKQVLEPILEPVFDDNSYGYRPGRSAHDAIAVVRRRSWEYDWVVEFDIKGLFDHIDHDLLLRAVRKHCSIPWVLLYVQRWLRAPLETEIGERVGRDRGTPQGGVASPLLANLFLHYAIDAWIRREMSSVRLCRYADDGVIHCRSQAQARLALDRLGARLRDCGLELHPEKTRIVYCKDVNRTADYPATQFTFLGYTFRPRRALDKNSSPPGIRGHLCIGSKVFTPRPADGSRMSREAHVRFCEGLGLQCPGLLTPSSRGRRSGRAFPCT